MGWLTWTIGIIIALIIIFIIIKKLRNKDEDEEDIWSQVKRVKRGGCGKIKELLWGC